mgnify:CR=1 FL=1
MKKRYAALFAAVFALSMITGCGGSEKADTGTTASAQPAEQGRGSGLRGREHGDAAGLQSRARP